jgi:hypothetical protein
MTTTNRSRVIPVSVFYLYGNKIPGKYPKLLFVPMRKKTRMLSLLAALLPVLLSSQVIQLNLPEETVLPEETIQIQLETSGFAAVVSLQFSINWNPDVLTYMSHEITDLPNVAIGDSEAAEGKLRLSWFDVEGSGSTLPDNSSVVAINFLVVGNLGDSTPLVISDDPLDIQIFQATDTPGIFSPMELDQSQGMVFIGAPGTITFNSEMVSCFGANDGSIALNIPPGSNYTYSWTGPENFTSGDQDIDNLIPGTYNVTVTDNSGDIIFENSFYIIQPSEIVVQNIETSPASCNQSIGSADIFVNGGQGPLTFDIGDQQNSTGSFSALAAGNFFLTITDANNCIATDTFFIEAADAPQVDLGPDLEICAGDNPVLDAGQFLNYLWSDGSTLNTLEITQSGIYSVTVSNDPECPGTDEIAVNIIELPELIIDTADITICPGDTAQLQVTGGDFYVWSGPVEYLNSTNIPAPLAFPDTTVIFFVMSENECGSDEVEVEVSVAPAMGFAGPDTCVILETEVRLLAFGGEFYFWHPNEYPGE